ncbi:Ran GTPase binding protein [Heterostelium album PN500]|uniref:Ran GTPase binding protein n=1 Tax=Heterostelium pallidum (strain ATCC 26659 / Pp 5 / PN500) TaxID=670386 RepID=D3BUQ1_HETP5|nr:Ran GTPase binding protein [Heterostelium album PN500]EFA74839.1 Ran GTPase binding protein [Heterostelium album PN500]|eukprot:XP_020426973.1 Ran GTPase binding protein [Heterostelium album PN500]
MSDFKVRQLYGGAIEISIPSRFIDITAFRVIPDHQECFVDDRTDQSIIIELLERQDHVADHESAAFHFNVVADEADVAADKRTILNHRALTKTDMPHFEDEVPKFILLGKQMMSKFNETAENTLNVYMAIVRLNRSKTDLLITLNAPLTLSSESSSVKAVGGTVPSFNPQEVENIFVELLKTLHIKDYSLFQHQ